MKKIRSILAIMLLACCCTVNLSYAGSKKSIELSDGTELSYFHFPAKGKPVYIWLAPEAGLQNHEKITAKKLAMEGIEVW